MTHDEHNMQDVALVQLRITEAIIASGVRCTACTTAALMLVVRSMLVDVHGELEGRDPWETADAFVSCLYEGVREIAGDRPQTTPENN